MQTWYEVIKWSGRVRPIEVERTTDKQLVMPDGRRVAKNDSMSAYFDNAADAVQFAKRLLGGKRQVAMAHIRDYDATLADLQARYPQEFAR